MIYWENFLIGFFFPPPKYLNTTWITWGVSYASLKGTVEDFYFFFHPYVIQHHVEAEPALNKKVSV